MSPQLLLLNCGHFGGEQNNNNPVSGQQKTGYNICVRVMPRTYSRHFLRRINSYLPSYLIIIGIIELFKRAEAPGGAFALHVHHVVDRNSA
jgi:hypothetical protein